MKIQGWKVYDNSGKQLKWIHEKSKRIVYLSVWGMVSNDATYGVYIANFDDKKGVSIIKGNFNHDKAKKIALDYMRGHKNG